MAHSDQPPGGRSGAGAASDPALAQEAPLRQSELGDAAALVREAGWNQVEADWRIFLELGSVYAVRNRDGRVVATAATLPYGGRFAWISMVLVAGDHRRQGLATRLLRRCIDDLTGRGLTPVLDATPAGRTVYIGLGFQDSWGLQRLTAPSPVRRGEAPGAPGISVEAITDAIWPSLRRYDAQAFGADRGAVLARLRGRAPGAEFVAHNGDRVVGFLLGRKGRTATQLGPLVAEDESIATALLQRALPNTDGSIYIDLADSKSAVRRWLDQRGFSAQRPYTRMLHERAKGFDDPLRTVAVAGPELG